jgi:hypothetical protein
MIVAIQAATRGSQEWNVPRRLANPYRTCTSRTAAATVPMMAPP